MCVVACRDSSSDRINPGIRVKSTDEEEVVRGEKREDSESRKRTTMATTDSSDS